MQKMNKSAVTGNIENRKMASVKSEAKVVESYSRDSRVRLLKEIFNMKIETERWLLENLIPTGALSSCVAPSDVGKSIFGRQVAVSIALGRDTMVGLKLKPKYGKSIYVSTEDMDLDWKEKLELYSLSEDEKIKLGENMLLITDYSDLEKVLTYELKHHPVDLVVIDVFTDVFGDDLNNSIQVRKFLKPFKKMAADYGASFLFIHHVSKKGEFSGIANKQNVLGSQAFESAMRSVFELRKDPENIDQRVCAITKNNYLPEKIKSLKMKLTLTPKLLYEKKDAMDSSGLNKEDVISRVYELNDQGASCREIEKHLVEEGMVMGKSKISEVIRKRKLGIGTQLNCETTSEQIIPDN